MKRRLLTVYIISSILFLSSLVMIGITFGWFASAIDLNTGTVSVGDLRYSLSGDFITDSTIIYPGTELVDTAFSVDNQSPIDSQLRVKISYTKITRPVDVLVIETVNYSNVDDHISVTFDSTFVYSSDYWYYNATDAVISAESGVLSILSSIYYDGEYTGNDYSEQTVGITITIEVKQSDNVTWAELATYDFSTGYPE